MINSEELKTHSFFESHVWAKLKTIVFCAVQWEGLNAKGSKLLSVASLDFAEDDELIKDIKADYDFIRAKLIKDGFETLTGKDGEWIQAGKKGIGGINSLTSERRPITRAFYARTGSVYNSCRQKWLCRSILKTLVMPRASTAGSASCGGHRKNLGT